MHFRRTSPRSRFLAGNSCNGRPLLAARVKADLKTGDYKNTAYSIFGTADFEITNGLILTGGFNYTKDKKDVASNTTVTDVLSNIDMFQVAAAAGIPASLPPGSFRSVADDDYFPADQKRARPVCTGRDLQPVPGVFNHCSSSRRFLNIPNAVESGKTSDDKLTYSVRLAWESD